MDPPDDNVPFLCSKRWILAYMGFMFGLISYLYRVNMSVAIVCMVKSPSGVNHTYLETYSNFTFNQTGNDTTERGEYTEIYPHRNDECLQQAVYEGQSQSHIQEGEFDWQKTTQSMVLAAFYYGYIVSQIPGGWLSRRYGGKHVITFCVAVQVVLTLLVPVLTRLSFYGLIVVRVIIGICSGASAPSIFDLFGVWALPSERSRFVTLFWLGKMLGTVLGYATSGFLCVHGFDNGWGSVFYVHGTAGAVFVLLWVFLVHSSPSDHPRISKSELLCLQQRLSTVSRKQQRRHGVPWGSILCYVPVWGIFLTHICDNWTNALQLTCLPLFIKEVLKYDTQSNGLLSALPSISTAVGLTVAGFAADKVISTERLTVTTTRKLLTCIGSVGAAVLVVVSGYITCDRRELVIIAFSFCTFFQSFVSAAGYPCNPVEIAPRFGSIIYAISNTIASLPGMVLPIVVAHLTQTNTRAEWLTVFYITAGFALLGMLIYTALANSNQAPWAEDDRLQEEKKRADDHELQSLNQES